jgi:bla regulator protein BlaR1
MHEFGSWWMVGWIISNTVVGGLIAVLAIAADRWARRPALAHVLWVLVLIKLLTPPIVTLPIAVDPSRLTWLSDQWIGHNSRADSRDDLRMSSMGVALGTAAATPQPRGGLLMVITVASVWGAGTVLLSLWVVSSARRLKRLINRNGRLDPAATAQVTEMSADRRAPPVWLVAAVVSPMLVGVGRRTRIVFPAGLWSMLDDDSRRLLLLHELEHCRRCDPWVRYLEAIAWTVLWWHPLVWVARQQIEDCEERCCDLAAARGTGDTPRVYAEAILTTIDFLSEPGHLCPSIGKRPIASALGRVPQIEQRLRGIMSPEGRSQLGISSRCFVAVMLLLLPLHPALVFNRGVDPDHSVTVAKR